MADGIDVTEDGGRNLGGEVFPTQEIVPGAFLAFQHVESIQGLVDESFILGGLYEGGAAFNIYIYHSYRI